MRTSGYVRGPVEIEMGPAGRGAIVVRGHDVSNYVSGVRITTKAGEPTVVVLEMIAMDVMLSDPDARVLLSWRDEAETEEAAADAPCG